MAKDSTLVLAYFDNEAAADAAVQDLKGWDKASEDIKLGAIGILVKDEKGKIKTQKLGARAGGSGAKTGMILGVIAAILSGGVTLLGGLVGGAVGGGILGSFFHKGLKLSPDDLKNLNSELDAGHAAVGVMLDPTEVDSTSAKLAELGGRIETHEISGEAIDNAEQVAADAGVATADATSGAGAAASNIATDAGTAISGAADTAGNIASDAGAAASNIASDAGAAASNIASDAGAAASNIASDVSAAATDKTQGTTPST